MTTTLLPPGFQPGLSPGQILPPPPNATPAEKARYEENLNVHLICAECKEYPPNIVEEFSSGDLVCGSCGLCFPDRIIDTRSEWRTFANDEGGGDDPNRVGDATNPLLNGSQLETAISGGTDLLSRELSKAQSRAGADKTTRSLLTAYKEISALCESISLQKPVQDAAKHLFKLAEEQKSLRSKNTEAIIAGCIFIACRQCKVDRTFREIYSLTKVPKKDIGKVFKQLERLLASKTLSTQSAISTGEVRSSGGMNSNEVNYTPKAATSAHELVVRFWNLLGLNSRDTLVAQGVAEECKRLGTLDGRSPISSAAACIFFASALLGSAKSAREISAVAGVSDGTIRNAYKMLYAVKEKLVKKEWLDNKRGDLSRLPPA